MREAHRFIGLELSGAKNDKSALACIEYYAKERKVFLLDVYDKVEHAEDQDADQALLELIAELKTDETTLTVNVPLTLPPCISCKNKACSIEKGCKDASVKWTRNYLKKAEKQAYNKKRIRPFTPYTQRPVEAWIRYEIDTGLEVDEALGGNKAPLTSRMHILKKSLGDLHLVEAMPKLTLMALAQIHRFPKRWMQSYRNLDLGIEAREDILEALIRAQDIFIYERDLRKLSHNLACFDAFLCAFTGLMSHLGRCQEPPAHFPVESGWVSFPEFEHAHEKDE